MWHHYVLSLRGQRRHQPAEERRSNGRPEELSRDVGRDRVVRVFCYAANLLTLGFGLLFVTLDTEPQVIFGMVMIVLMTVTAFALRGAQNNPAS